MSFKDVLYSIKMNCEFCNKIFSNKSSLNNHKKTAKYCLKIQDNKEISKFECDYCIKIFTSRHNLNLHLLNCKDKEIEIIRKEKDKEIEILRKEKDKEIEIIRKENKKQEEQIKELQETIERMGLRAIERPTTTNTTTTTNNTLNITSSIDFNDVDKVKNIIEDKLNINYVIDGQKGIANFIKDNILTDDNGELIYVCTDPSRGIFKFKDTTGELKKDIEAKKLTTYILEGGIKKKSAVIGNEWCKDDTGEFDMKKFTILMVPQQSIMNLSQDNNILKRELAAITS